MRAGAARRAASSCSIAADDVRDFAAKLLGKPLVTHQTGPEGRVVRRVYVEEASEVARELYLGMLVDRKAGTVSVIASTEGGMDIEEVAGEDARENSHRADRSAARRVGLPGAQDRVRAGAQGQAGRSVRDAARRRSTRAFIETDASLIEINPLVVTKDNRVICLDAKMSFDDNALFRHPDIRELRDPNEEDPAETEAAKFDLSYVHLDGNIGCMVNGAGLAMATMDIVKHLRRRAGQLSRRRRRREHREGRGGVSHPARGQARQRRAHQHLRRHHAMRRAGAGRGRGGEAGQTQRAAGGQDGRHQRRRGQERFSPSRASK